MAELHLIGSLLKAIEFEQPHIYCKWSLQSGATWQVLQGDASGQTFVSSNRLENSSDFNHPIDVHICTVSIQGWPKIFVEVYAVNALHNSWPVGYGFVHIPSQPGAHRVEIHTWKVAPTTWWDRVKEKFGGGGATLCKSDLVFSGHERYKLQTSTSGRVILEFYVVTRNFKNFGIEFN